ncbi:MAG TPA: S8 family serine peptidase [Casimicrobiaceae bacterium]|nr:S8 family serine peptidase [Casimicrobiaceae bacterium]
MESVLTKPSHFRRTRIAAGLATMLGAFGAAPYAFAQPLQPVVPPPISSYPGDPGTTGNPPSWRTAEFLRDWGLQALSAEFAYAAGFAGQGMNVGVIDSGYFDPNPDNVPPIPVGWRPEHQDASGNDRWISVLATGGTTGPTPGFFNQAYNDTHGTHVSGTVAARRDGGSAATAVNPAQPVTSDMHGVSFDANVSFGNTHKTDSAYYGRQPAGAPDVLLIDNAYIENVYPAVAASVSPSGTPVRIVHSSWGSAPPTENYNTYCPPPGGSQFFGELAGWQYISTPDGVADGNGHTSHWLNGAIAVARSGTIISFSAGNAGALNPTPRGSAPYFLPDLEGHWVAVSGLNLPGQTLNPDGSVLVPGSETFNQCGLVKWSCVTAPSNNINSLQVRVVNGTPIAVYGAESGTSMAGPHSASTMNLVMQRFPYMTNAQAMYTVFTTGRQNATISDPNTGAAVPNPTQGQMVQVPDKRNGWGTPNLKDAFRGPAQLLGVFNVDTQGFSDLWSNDISDVALRARQQEDAAEAALWNADHVTNSCVLSLPSGSPLLQTDLAAGQARAAARATRVYKGTLTKNGVGTLFLTGDLTYAGSTNVNGGKLSINGSDATDVVVNGGTLGGKGSIAGGVNVVTGLLWPGLSPDEATFIGGVTAAGNVLSFGSPVHIGHKAGFAATIRSATDYSQVVTSSNLILDGALFLDIAGAPPPGSVLTIMSGKKVVGTFSGLPEGSSVVASGQRFRISYVGNKVTLTALGT